MVKVFVLMENVRESWDLFFLGSAMKCLGHGYGVWTVCSFTVIMVGYHVVT